jgi:hypothetical protein
MADGVMLHTFKVRCNELQEMASALCAGHDKSAAAPRVARALEAAAQHAMASITPVDMYFGGSYVYILELTEACWYVGTTTDLQARLFAHFNGMGAEWTKVHRPVRVANIAAGGREEENALTLHVMRQCGWRNVRGGLWCAVDLASQPRALLLSQPEDPEAQPQEDPQAHPQEDPQAQPQEDPQDPEDPQAQPQEDPQTHPQDPEAHPQDPQNPEDPQAHPQDPQARTSASDTEGKARQRVTGRTDAANNALADQALFSLKRWRQVAPLVVDIRGQMPAV